MFLVLQEKRDFSWQIIFPTNRWSYICQKLPGKEVNAFLSPKDQFISFFDCVTNVTEGWLIMAVRYLMETGTVKLPKALINMSWLMMPMFIDVRGLFVSCQDLGDTKGSGSRISADLFGGTWPNRTPAKLPFARREVLGWPKKPEIFQECTYMYFKHISTIWEAWTYFSARNFQFSWI